MSTIVNTGWLKDNNGEKFAPKTLSSQVVTSDGTILESKINAMEATLSDVTDNLIYIGDGETSSSALLDADSLGGYLASEYYTAEEVDEKLANAGGSSLVFSEVDPNVSTTTLNADSLGGHLASEYYTAEQVDAKLADIDVSTQIQESLNGLKFVVLSQANYDALTTKDPNTIYYIYEEV